MRITVVYDNYTYRDGLGSKWGFGALVKRGELAILFDTGGEGRTLLGNMRALSLDPQAVKLVVLSHEHRDHTGGLPAVLGRAADATVCVPASFSDGIKTHIRQAGAKLLEVTEATELAPGVHSTGDIAGPVREQALVLRARDGLVVLTGCAHPGVVTMARAATVAAEGEVLFVGGGFHLNRAREPQIDAAIEGLRELGVRSVGPTHCTGDRAIRKFYEAFGSDFVQMGVGRELDFDD